jgi:hypothetical protein
MVEAWIHLTAARIDQTLVLRVYAKLKCSARWWITRTAITAAAECDQRTKRWRVAVGQSNRSHARTFPGGRRLRGASPPAENSAGLILSCEGFFIWKRAAKPLKLLKGVLAVFPNAP